MPSVLPYTVAEIALLALLAWAGSRLVWTLLASSAPVGLWPSVASNAASVDRGLMTRFDPFFRLAEASGPVVVTSLPLKLTGTRVDQAMGRGSAIIMTPDGQQASFAVGETIVPGVTLKSVAFDSVTVERSGVAEQLFLDQSKPAAVANPGAADPGVATPGLSGKGIGPAPPANPLLPSGQGGNAAPLPPSPSRGPTAGFAVTPQANPAFAAAGLQPGDVVTQINGAGIRTAEDAAQAVANRPASGELTLTVERGGKTISLSTKVPK